MRIAFDAKRAFMNNTGLGQYSRNLVAALAQGYPQHEYWLATPKVTDMFIVPAGMHTITPQGWYKAVPALWRSNGVRHDLDRLGINLYHGLSHEIPVGLKGSLSRRGGIKTVVTMHDLIFERYPEQYKAIDVAVYRRKFRYACQHADIVIAISEQTRQDLQYFYKVPPERIRVCYQSCNPAFAIQAGDAERELTRHKYGLPTDYLLYVGSVIERKNLLTICKALVASQGKMDMPLAVIGTGKEYLQQVKNYIKENGLTDRVMFLSEVPGGVAGTDMPAIYQAAQAMIYPSVYEGFGIPILESLWAQTPVITSNVSCMPETGGDAAYYINPGSVDEMAEAILQVTTNSTLRDDMVRKGLVHAQKFTPQLCATGVMNVYKDVVNQLR